MKERALDPCPCGKTPTKLHVNPGSTFRWRYVSGDCDCGWFTEVRINTMRPTDEAKDYDECVDAWNQLERG